jgi:hypothetical protein
MVSLAGGVQTFECTAVNAESPMQYVVRYIHEA